jgi:hypothetical protein
MLSPPMLFARSPLASRPQAGLSAGKEIAKVKRAKPFIPHPALSPSGFGERAGGGPKMIAAEVFISETFTFTFTCIYNSL